jgi:tRNA pseudouridine55 synthase
MDGIFNINKPEGRSSFSVVAEVRRLTGERRVGHAGTLDVTAGGVLPVCLGRGTRVVEFLMDTRKVYRAQIKLGIATDTYDAAGRVIQQGDTSGISREKIELALGTFCGDIMQAPPMYSALKYRGRRLYELARAGIIVERQSRPVRVYCIQVLDFKTPLVTLEIECARGTYIRSLAHDLGQILGCGAHLERLSRTRYGPFDIADAVSLARLEAAFSDKSWQRLVYPIDTVLHHWSAVVVGEEQERVIKSGGGVVIEDGVAGDGGNNMCCAYNKSGCFLAVLRFDQEGRRWKAKKVFA